MYHEEFGEEVDVGGEGVVCRLVSLLVLRACIAFSTSANRFQMTYLIALSTLMLPTFASEFVVLKRRIICLSTVSTPALLLLCPVISSYIVQRWLQNPIKRNDSRVTMSQYFACDTFQRF